MELSIIRRETTGAPPNQYNESETITKFEVSTAISLALSLLSSPLTFDRSLVQPLLRRSWTEHPCEVRHLSLLQSACLPADLLLTRSAPNLA